MFVVYYCYYCYYCYYYYYCFVVDVVDVVFRCCRNWKIKAFKKSLLSLVVFLF
jgi:hypothetical protein